MATITVVDNCIVGGGIGDRTYRGRWNVFLQHLPPVPR